MHKLKRILAVLVAIVMLFGSGDAVFAFVPSRIMSDELLKTVDVYDDNLYWSPYSWYDGKDFKQTVQSGGYVKIAFTGKHLGICVDLAQMSEQFRDNVLLNAYIDGSDRPIVKKLSDTKDDEIVFSDSLEQGNHYAIIYLGDSICTMANRWDVPLQCALRITGLKLSADASTVRLDNTRCV